MKLQPRLGGVPVAWLTQPICWFPIWLFLTTMAVHPKKDTPSCPAGLLMGKVLTIKQFLIELKRQVVAETPKTLLSTLRFSTANCAFPNCTAMSNPLIAPPWIVRLIMGLGMPCLLTLAIP